MRPEDQDDAHDRQRGETDPRQNQGGSRGPSTAKPGGSRGREAGYGTVYYSNAFDEQGVVTGRIRIGSFGETDSPAVIVAREGRKSLFHLDDVERIDYHAPDDE
ncbi:hypothetical protein [Halalkalicoccus salilacus]|uniref:hypothetical protein n=1 Tax=Halalkalicoccus sp. GCM10025704 TaxID=3252662 RepID=UPI00360856D3